MANRKREIGLIDLKSFWTNLAKDVHGVEPRQQQRCYTWERVYSLGYNRGGTRTPGEGCTRCTGRAAGGVKYLGKGVHCTARATAGEAYLRTGVQLRLQQRRHTWGRVYSPGYSRG